jgi:hypothetical protein
MYHIFHRTWWKRNPAWPDGREPKAGEKHTIARGITSEAVAREICRDWNANHDEGELSDRAEYESE